MKREHPSIVVGLDVGDRMSHAYAMDFETGEVLAEGPVATTPKAMRRFLGHLGKGRVVLEVGTHSRWLSALLQDMGHEVLVANARKLRMIYADSNKQDRLDARKLAWLGHAEPRLLYPIRHRGPRTHEDLALVRARAHLVRQRTATINAMRGMVKAVGARLPRCSSNRFASRVAEEVPAGLQAALGPLRQVVELLDATIRGYDQALESMAKERYPETEVLRQVPGVGPVTALAYVLTLEDPGRFRKSRDVGPALGLVPRRDQSGDCDRQLRITKTGDRYLRALLVEAAQCHLRESSPDTDLKRWGLKRADRGGSAARKRAAVAVARRLAVLLHRLWVTGAKYEPLRQAA